MRKASTRSDQSIQKKAQAECRKLRAMLKESISIYNQMADLLDTPTLKIVEVPKTKAKTRRR